METTGTEQKAPRAQAPIRWPHPSRADLAVFALWALGGVIALAVPALIVSPGESGADASEVWSAFAVTLLGAAVMIGASALIWRRTKDSGALILGGVPAVAVVAGGVILAATKLTT